MKKVTLNDLKTNLAKWLGIAIKEGGITITRYNRPYVRIVPDRPPALQIGSQFGKADLNSVIKTTKGNILDTLLADRS